MCKLYVLTHPVGALCASDRRRVTPHSRSEEAKMAELHNMEMGWSGSGWMDPLPSESRSSSPSSSRSFDFGDTSESESESSADRRAKRSTRKAARKSGRATKRSARKTARKG